jgi:tRNA-specific 2-thiouridylase
MTRVMVAMSGGVDSSVAAAMMVEEGHDVIGATLKLWQGPNGEAPTAGCCTVSDSEDARRVAAQLDIPYYVLDYTDDFMSGVVDRFIGDYLDGRTPNPCVECNRTVKFSRLLDQAADFDCDVLVTGHYARTRRTDAGWQLLNGVDPDKDQSYVLYMLGQSELARVRFPVGEQTKIETRSHAESLGLRTAGKPDSQDICFVGKGDYRDFLREHSADVIKPGFVVDTDGERPTVTLGRKEDLATTQFSVHDVTWVSGSPPAPGVCDVKVRYKSAPVRASVTPVGSDADVELHEAQGAIAPGQAAVFYSDDVVLGGGTIVAS